MHLKKVNLGCGKQVVDRWINVDYALGARMFKFPLFPFLNSKLNLFNMEWDENILIHDLRRKFPFKDGSVDVIYSSHTLEHFSRDEGRRFLEECYRVNKTNGIVRIVVPDLKGFVEKYKSGIILAEDFCEQLLCRPSLSGKGFFRRFVSNMFSFPHECMYDKEALVRVLRDVGFEAESRKPFESEIADIRDIEIEDRVLNSVVVEGKKTA